MKYSLIIFATLVVAPFTACQTARIPAPQKSSNTLLCSSYEPVTSSAAEPIDGLIGLMRQTHYPNDAVVAGAEGRVQLRLFINTLGYVDSVEVERSVFPSIDIEAIRVVQKSRFIPAKKDGQAVCSKQSLTMVFKLPL
jgi:TonB family protein